MPSILDTPNLASQRVFRKSLLELAGKEDLLSKGALKLPSMAPKPRNPAISSWRTKKARRPLKELEEKIFKLKKTGKGLGFLNKILGSEFFTIAAPTYFLTDITRKELDKERIKYLERLWETKLKGA